jgi:hypothetical protein
MMDADLAMRRVKGLQKELLAKIEAHPVLTHMDHDAFHDLRKRVFRGTFAAYKLGVIGLDTVARDDHSISLSEYFFCWLTYSDAMRDVPTRVRIEVTELCLYAALDAYRLGAFVAATDTLATEVRA